jgi:hypothetical protein
MTNPEKIERLKAKNFGLIFVRDLIPFTKKTLLGVWPDLMARRRSRGCLAPQN